MEGGKNCPLDSDSWQVVLVRNDCVLADAEIPHMSTKFPQLLVNCLQQSAGALGRFHQNIQLEPPLVIHSVLLIYTLIFFNLGEKWGKKAFSRSEIYTSNEKETK